MKKTDLNTTLAELKTAVTKFRDERGWRERNNAKNIAISLCLEAAELLEHFQWDDTPENEIKSDAVKLTDIAFEMADCFVYLLAFSERMNVDIASHVLQKLKLTAKKYPLSRFNKKHQDIEYYYQIKKKYRCAKLKE